MVKEFVSAKYTASLLTVDYAASDGSHLLRSGGTIAWRFNNPGNLRPAKTGVPIYGAIGVGATKSNGEFLIFASYTEGRAQKKALLRRKYNERTIYTMLAGIPDKKGKLHSGYAPASDKNDPEAYAEAISKPLGLPTTTVLSDLSDAQLETMLDAMEKKEGFHGQKATRIEKEVNGTTVTISDGAKPRANMPVKVAIDGKEQHTSTDAKGQLPKIVHLDQGKKVVISAPDDKGGWTEVHQFITSAQSSCVALFHDAMTFIAPTDVKKARTPAPAQPAARKPITYIVQSGDTLGKIASRYKTTVADIKRDNPQIKDVTKIYPAQKISLYGKGASAAVPAPKAARPKLQQVPPKAASTPVTPPKPAAAPARPAAPAPALARSKEGTGEPLALLHVDQRRAPWMTVATAEAKKWGGKTEDVITKTSNFHQKTNAGFLTTMVGKKNAWCASFVNFCLTTSTPGYVKWKNSFRARAVALDANFVEIKKPIFGAIVLVGTHHATLAYATWGKNIVCLGGNQADQINFTPFKSDLRYFVPLAYHEFAKKEIERGNSLAEHTPEELNKAFGIVIKVKKGNATQ
jgi:LysM repeat protein